MQALTSIEGVNIALSGFQSVYNVVTHQDDISWNEIGYFHEVRQLRHDMLNNVREEMYDIYEKNERMLETNLLVATLMMGIGFGFAFEGTFPSDVKSQWLARYCYTASAAFGLVFPFLSMIGFLECRKRLHQFMSCFNHAFSSARRAENDKFVGTLSDARRICDYAHETTAGLPGTPQSANATVRMSRALCCRRRVTSYAKGDRAVVEATPPAVQAPVRALLNPVAEFDNWTAKHVDKLQRTTEVLLRIGVAADLATSALLLGAYFQSTFPDTPHLWMVYSGIVGLGVLVWSFTLCPMSGFDTQADPTFKQPFLPP